MDEDGLTNFCKSHGLAWGLANSAATIVGAHR